ncbi:hypothetical protein HOD29_05730 [archaeon]|jgi:hypothetical protein|nr:hypothetical protein [archaeon]
MDLQERLVSDEFDINPVGINESSGANYEFEEEIYMNEGNCSKYHGYKMGILGK